MPEKEYKELKSEDFSLNINHFKEEIIKDPENPLNYYYLAKEYMLKVPLRVIDDLKYLENLLKKSLEIAPDLWAPKIFLGELLFKQNKFTEAEKYFREIIKEKPESVSVREYLAKCIENKSSKHEETSEKDLLYLFENDLREFIKKVLEKEFKNDWWRKGIPAKVRSDCVAKKELGLDEEKDLDPILFANFYDYKEIIQQNKAIFSQCLDVKIWCSKLNEIEPIRNVIAHNSKLEKAFEKVKKCYDEFRGVLIKYGRNLKTKSFTDNPKHLKTLFLLMKYGQGYRKNKQRRISRNSN